MKSVLIGYTGFVGSNLAAQHQFDDLYNTSNIQEIEGKTYDLIVSAGARAEKWRINQEPEKDLAEIDGLIEHLKKVKADKFVLISSVDVYKTPVDVNEDTTIETEGLHGYGANRYHLEQFVKSQFNNSTIVRLPGLFGPGLKKNVIYDLMHDNNIDKIHHAGSFQYYNLNNIWKDIEIAINSNVKLINFATEPVRTDEIAKECFGIDFTNEPEGVSAGSYDMKSKYANLYSGKNGYLYSKQQIIDEMRDFVAEVKAS